MTTTIVIIIIVAILAIWLVSIYNRLVKLRNNRENAFANIDVQLKQRCDLIPQLVATVKGYATHEKETLQRVTDARAASMGAQTINLSLINISEPKRRTPISYAVFCLKKKIIK